MAGTGPTAAGAVSAARRPSRLEAGSPAPVPVLAACVCRMARRAGRFDPAQRKPDTDRVTDRRRLRWDGPLSQRMVLLALGVCVPVSFLGGLAWLIGLPSVGKVLLAVSSAACAAVLFAALAVERRERRQESEAQ
jgi:hypothetical protein